MNENYWPQMKNDICFVNLTEGYENWCKDKTTRRNWPALMMVALITGMFISISWIARDPTPAIVGVIGGILGYFTFSQDAEWPSVLDEYLNDYQPVDTDVFIAFQASVKAEGELRKETLGKWIDVERKARLQRPRRSTGSTFTGRDMTSIGNKTNR